MATPKVKTTEELIIDEWMYIQRLAKVHESIILPTDTVQGLLPDCYQNQGINNRLNDSFVLRKRSSTKISELTGINLDSFKAFIETELKQSGIFISSSLLNLSEVKTSDEA